MRATIYFGDAIEVVVSRSQEGLWTSQILILLEKLAPSFGVSQFSMVAVAAKSSRIALSASRVRAESPTSKDGLRKGGAAGVLALWV